LNGFLLNILEIMFESLVTGLGKLTMVGKFMSVMKGITMVGVSMTVMFNGVLGTSTPLFFDVLKMGYSFEAVGKGVGFTSSSSVFLSPSGDKLLCCLEQGPAGVAGVRWQQAPMGVG
jgi:hypothetical protein